MSVVSSSSLASGRNPEPSYRDSSTSDRDHLTPSPPVQEDSHDEYTPTRKSTLAPAGPRCDLPTLLQTLYAGTVRFDVLPGAIKPESEVTQEEIELACRNANIPDFINSLPESVLLLGFSSDRFALL
jgi:hypothetical protein